MELLRVTTAHNTVYTPATHMEAPMKQSFHVLAMTFVLTFSNVVISIMRNIIPKNIRIIVELVVISSLVILADELLQAFMFDISKKTHKDLKKKRITTKVYYERLAKFWEKHGFPEFAEETLLYAQD